MFMKDFYKKYYTTEILEKIKKFGYDEECSSHFIDVEDYNHLWDYHGNYRGQFDAEMLTWSDKKLEKYVKDILDKEKKSEEERKQNLEDAERKEYERLKQKFG